MMTRAKAPTIRIDPELARLSIGLNLASHFRLWAISRHLTRQDNGSSKVSRKDVKGILRHFGIRYTRQQVNHLIRSGEGLFWNADKNYIYLRSWAFVAKQLTQNTLDENRALLSNKPGVMQVSVSPAGSLEQWEATIYAGWLYYRDNPTIARSTLEKLFNRTANTLRRWEDDRLQCTLTKRKNYAQTPYMRVVDQAKPEPVFSYIAKTPEGAQVRLMWQVSNSYKVKGIKEHTAKGQAPKVRKQVNVQLQQPANYWRGGLPVVLLYFNNAKRLRSHLKSYEGVYYLYRGHNRHKHGIFEATDTGYPETSAKERVHFATERRLRGELQLDNM